MSKSTIGEQPWAEISEVQKGNAVDPDRATLNQLTEGSLGGSEESHDRRQQYPAHTNGSVEDTSVDTDIGKSLSDRVNIKFALPKRQSSSKRKKKVLNTKPRFGLPEGFSPRPQGYVRSLLLEDNIYRLPDNKEFVPKKPVGPLGKPRHLYALLTVEQVEAGSLGSVYVHADGRIFDYSVDHRDPLRDMFDTGYTIHDLQRTGRYAPPTGSQKERNEKLKPGRSAHAG